MGEVDGGDEGMTLVELLVAMFIFGVVFAAVAAALISTTRAIGEQSLRAAATRVASDHLEMLRAVPFEELENHQGELPVTTPAGREFVLTTEVVRVAAATGQPAADGEVKQMQTTVSWQTLGMARSVAHTTAIAPEDMHTQPGPSIGQIMMFPNPAAAAADGAVLDDVEIVVPLEGFSADQVVHVTWVNEGIANGAKDLTSGDGVNWAGAIPAEQMRALLDGGVGEIEFTVTAGTLTARYALAIQEHVAAAPTITAATISAQPIIVSSPAVGRTCADRNQCENTTDVVFEVAVDGLDPTQDSVVLQFQLFDGSFQEEPLAFVEAEGVWRTTVTRKTTKFLTGTNRAFRFTAIRSADSATTGHTELRDVMPS